MQNILVVSGKDLTKMLVQMNYLTGLKNEIKGVMTYAKYISSIWTHRLK